MARTTYTHRVIATFRGPNGDGTLHEYQPGEKVCARGWPNLPLLLRQDFLERLDDDERATRDDEPEPEAVVSRGRRVASRGARAHA